jgi:ketosteroid isomerase-like protein
MASRNVDFVRSLYDDWARGDFSSVEWADPEIELEFADGPSPGRWTGLAGLAEGYREWLAGWEDVRVMADEFYELDDERVFVLVRGSGHGRASGLEMEQLQPNRRGGNLFHVRNGRVTRLVLYYDGEHALADFGLVPEVDSSAS